MSWRNVIWVEPYRFRFLTRAERVRTARHEFPICFIMVSANFLLIWLLYYLLAWLDPSRKVLSLMNAVPYIVWSGLLVACLWCGGNYLSPRTIAFGKERVVCSIGEHYQRWHYDQIAYVCFDTMPEGTGVARVMLIVPRDGPNVVIGVPKRLKLAKLTDFLKSKGVETTENHGGLSDCSAEV